MIARVFPRRTRATPVDDLAFTGPPGLFPPEVDAVHVSVAFTWDLPRAEYLAREWKRVAPVKISGPALGIRSDEFTPGMYLRDGYTITSRGCPNRCWFCSVWQREGTIRELAITDGWNVLDDNLLACSESHIRAVFAMLKRQRNPVEFTGGLEAARLQSWHVDLLADLKPKQMFFAYDDPADFEPLVRAGKMLREAGITLAGKTMRAYVLIGHPRDQMADAERRLNDTLRAGFVPMAMLWRDKNGERDAAWGKLQRAWARPALMAHRVEVLREGLAPHPRE